MREGRHDVKATMRLTRVGRFYDVRVQLKAGEASVTIDLHRTDLKPSPYLELSLDDARELSLLLQASCDRTYQLAKAQAKKERAAAELDRVLERIPVEGQ